MADGHVHVAGADGRLLEVGGGALAVQGDHRGRRGAVRDVAVLNREVAVAVDFLGLGVRVCPPHHLQALVPAPE